MFRKYASFMAGPAGVFLADSGVFALRVWLGFSMLALHGWGKLAGYATMAGKFPDPLGVGSALSLQLAIFAEVVCAVLIVLGLASRFSSAVLAFTMAVAFFSVHGGALSGERSGELAFIYMAGYAALFLTGPGRFSVDHLILRSFGRKE